MIDWDIFFKIGGLAGFVTLFYLLIKDVVVYYRKPRLEIVFTKNRDLREYRIPDSNILRKFATLHIKNKRIHTAKRCVAVLRIFKKPKETTLIEDECSLLWSEIAYSERTTGADPLDIGFEPARLDVAFTVENKNSGCWLAMPFALSGHLTINQAYLYPGEYEVEIEVKCENGKGAKSQFKIISPNNWKDLDFYEN